MAEPGWVAAILERPVTFWGARLALAGAYLQGGATKALDFPAAVAEQAHFGMSPRALWAGLTLAVEVAGSLLLLSRRWVWLGAGLLGVFTVLAAWIANAFWTLPPGPARLAAANAFFEHLGLVGGFALAALAARRGAG